MGGAACWIIIKCGGLKAAADELAAAYPSGATGVAGLNAAAVGLSSLNDEICELGGEIEGYLTSDEKAQVIAIGERADDLRAGIEQFLSENRSAKLQTKMAAELRDFARDQYEFFSALADAHKNE